MTITEQLITDLDTAYSAYECWPAIRPAVVTALEKSEAETLLVAILYGEAKVIAERERANADALRRRVESLKYRLRDRSPEPVV